MAKAAKITVAVLAAVLLLLAGAAMIIQTQWAQQQLEAQLSQRLGDRAVDIGSLDVDWAWPLGIRLSDVKVANPEWAETPYMLELDALQVRLDPRAWLTGSLGLQLLGLEQPRVHLSRRADGRSNWAALIEEDSPDDSASPLQPERIRISDGQLTYNDAALDADITLDIATTEEAPGQRRLAVEGRGSVQGQPLSLSLTGDRPATALSSESPYAVKLDARLGEIRARFDGETQALPQLDALRGELKLTAPETVELIAFRQPAIDIPAFNFSAQLEREGPRWALQDMDLQTGKSQLNGSLVFEHSATPALTVKLNGEQLDLNRWGVMRWLQTDEPSAVADDSQASLPRRIRQMLEPLREYHADVDLTLDRLVYGDVTLNDIVLNARLAEQQLTIERLQVAQADGAIQASAALDLRQASLGGTLDVTVDQLDLGQALAPLGYETLGTLDGELHGRLEEHEARLSDTQLRYDAPAQDLWVEFAAESTDSGLHIQGDAERNGVPLHVELSGGPLLALFDDQPFPVDGTLTSRDSRFQVEGYVTDPFELHAADVQLSIRGPNPARLNPLLGLDLPSLAPYQLSGRLRWENEQLRLQGIRARWGESDLSGDVRLSLSGRTMLWANLYSNTLNTKDLKAPDTPTDPAGDQLFSDEPLGLDALRNRDAIIRYEAQRVTAKDIPLNAVDFKAELDNGVLQVEPLQLAIGGGQANGRLRVDVRPPQPTGSLQLALERIDLSPVLREADLSQVAQDSAGTIGGQLDIRFDGQSFGEMAAELNGQLELAMSGGKLDMLAVELLGLDAGEAAVAALSDSEQVEMNCAYLRFASEQGTAKLEQLFISTVDSNVTGGGTINLATEQLDLAFEAHAKDFSLLSGNSPVQLNGTLTDPQVEVVTNELIARAVASVVGALVAPPLAILPWVEAGLGEGAGVGCRKALNEFKRDRGN